MDLVTVTFSGDVKQMELQSYSINKWVKNSSHHLVIVEDKVLSVSEWYEILSPYYTVHKLTILPTLLPDEDYENESFIKNGYQRQQILKYLAADHVIDDSYLILDTKNFFIKPVDLNDWPVKEGIPYVHLVTENTSAPYSKWAYWVCDKYGLTKFPMAHEILTPFVMKTDISKEIMTLKSIKKFFFEPRVSINWESEFLFYSLFSQNKQAELTENDNKVELSTTHLFSSADQFNSQDKFIDDSFNRSTILLFGLHRKLLNELEQQHIDYLIEKLSDIGFDSQLLHKCLDKATT
jgi:hypothetical protein